MISLFEWVKERELRYFIKKKQYREVNTRLEKDF